jgi:lactoylglutathione lyase
MLFSRRIFLSGCALGAVPPPVRLATAIQARSEEKKMSALKQIRHLDYTVLFARDMAAMRSFYGEILGFEINRELGPSWIEYRVGSCLLALTEHGLMFNDEKTPVGALSAQLAFRVPRGEVDACADELTARGVVMELRPADQPWAHRTAFFRDPDGNIVEIYADI